MVPIKMKSSAEEEEEDPYAAEIEPETSRVHFELYFAGDFAGVIAIAEAICGCPASSLHERTYPQQLNSPPLQR
eukprot:4375810-Pleurochrysis_carterae.AAC.1